MRSSLAAISLLLALPIGNFGAVVWIDTDPSVQRGVHEVDDGFALVQAFHSPELQIRGISIVFGNAPLVTALPIGREIVQRFGPADMPVFSGAAGAQELGQETDASRALAAALKKERLTILALGPGTNIATVLRNHPELASRIDRIIAVAGRRPGQHFVTGKAKLPFRDFNFEMDSEAFQVILDSGVPLVLAPWEVSSKVWLNQSDLDRLVAADAALDWLAKPALDWLGFWKLAFAVDGFNPFDTLAVAYAVTPKLLRCEALPSKIETLLDDVVTDAANPGRSKPYLLAAKEIESSHSVQYCFDVQPAFKQDLMARLSRIPRTQPRKKRSVQ
jgi:pyrimidine-specific ribonucleoside hydrolase